jgi:hypothetical protein
MVIITFDLNESNLFNLFNWNHSGLIVDPFTLFFQIFPGFRRVGMLRPKRVSSTLCGSCAINATFFIFQKDAVMILPFDERESPSSSTDVFKSEFFNRNV